LNGVHVGLTTVQWHHTATARLYLTVHFNWIPVCIKTDYHHNGQDHPRSSISVPIESAYATSY